MVGQDSPGRALVLDVDEVEEPRDDLDLVRPGQSRAVRRQGPPVLIDGKGCSHPDLGDLIEGNQRQGDGAESGPVGVHAVLVGRLTIRRGHRLLAPLIDGGVTFGTDVQFQ